MTENDNILYPGLLCGQCKDGKGVSALLNRCTACHNANGLMIALLCKFVDEYQRYHMYVQ